MTKVVTYGTEVNINAFYRHSRIKQHLKDGRTLRIETVLNDPADLGSDDRPAVPIRIITTRGRNIGGVARTTTGRG